MGSTLERITEVAASAATGDAGEADALALLGQLAETRGGRAGRRADGAYFTAADVAEWMARRALDAWLLHRVQPRDARIDLELAPHELSRRVLDAARDDVDGARSLLSSIIVLDPTCGAGSFLRAAWTHLQRLQAGLDAIAGPGDERTARVSAHQLVGIDRDPDAVAACRASLRIVTGCDDAHVVGGDSLASGVGRLLDSHGVPRPDVVVGNPPFVRAARADAPTSLGTAAVPNQSAWIVELATDAANPGANVSFVLPVSTTCTDAFAPARRYWDRSFAAVVASHFDTIPSSLFPGAVQRLSILEGRGKVDLNDEVPATTAAWWTSRYHRWRRDERDGLLDRVVHVPLPPRVPGAVVPKVGEAVELRLLERLARHAPAGRHLTDPAGSGGNAISYKRRWSYFLLFTDFVPAIWDADGEPRTPTEFKQLHVRPQLDARVLLGAYSSTLFWWYFSVHTDNRNVNRRDLAAFPFPELGPATRAQLVALADELMDALRACAEVRTCSYRSIGTIRNTYFRQGATRPVLDRIDGVLADAYGMDDAERAFVLGFERRFRS